MNVVYKDEAGDPRGFKLSDAAVVEHKLQPMLASMDAIGHCSRH